MSITQLKGKVAAVLNEQQLVINIGEQDGVREGMRFAVLGPEPIIVRDPDSGEELDTLDPVKIRVEASEVRERVAVCATYRTHSYYSAGGAFGGLPAGLFDPPSVQREQQTLRADDPGAIPAIDPDKSYVRVGDRVVQIIESETDSALSE